jgi:Rrf2 family protein
MLTNKGKYGLKASVYLAGLTPGHTALVADIAAKNRIPKKFLDAILGELRVAGFLRSKKGKGGGYMLAKPANDIMVGDLIRTLDGPLAPFACASRTRYVPCDDCDLERCTVRRMMLKVRASIADVLDQHTLADMRALSPQRRKALTRGRSRPAASG